MIKLPFYYLILFSTFLFISCATNKKLNRPLVAKNKKIRNERKNKLFVFVGEKLEVTTLPQETNSMDGKFYAKYKILQRVYGSNNKDTIEFVVYDHYGIPSFAAYENVLLFVSKYKGKYYHEKYIFNDVYLTKDGRWAGTYSSDYGHPYNDSTSIRPEVIDFGRKVSYPLCIEFEDGDKYEPPYPEPYFRKEGDSAIAVYGNYIEELFKLKRDGVLTARGLFGNMIEEEPPIREISLVDFVPVYNEGDLRFMAYWDTLATFIKKDGVSALEGISFDSLRACGKIYKAEKFFNGCYPNIFTDQMINVFKDSSKVSFSWAEADYASLTSQAKKTIVKSGSIFRFREVLVSDEFRANTLELLFIETTQGYRFYGIDYWGKKKCCR